MASWTTEMRTLCQDRCAFYGDPPCWKLHEMTDTCPEPLAPCDDCASLKPSEEWAEWVAEMKESDDE